MPGNQTDPRKFERQERVGGEGWDWDRSLWDMLRRACVVDRYATNGT